jgi:hypothetical protein
MTRCETTHKQKLGIIKNSSSTFWLTLLPLAMNAAATGQCAPEELVVQQAFAGLLMMLPHARPCHI